MRPINVLSIDVEDVTHAIFRRGVVSSWMPSTIRYVLDLLAKYHAEATFFIVGEIVERFPEIADIIKEEGHEVAFHSFYHTPLWRMKPDELAVELRAFKRLVGDFIGFRAPMFSLDNRSKWAIKVLENEGIKYDSSVVPAETIFYGIPKAPLMPYRPSYSDVGCPGEARLYEFPLLIYEVKGLIKLPCHGGFFLRITPLNIIRKAIKRYNRQGLAGVIFIHTWELDTRTPCISTRPFDILTTRVGLKQGTKRLKQLLREFKFSSFEYYMDFSGWL